MNIDKVECTVRLVPAQFCFMRYTNDARYLPKYTSVKAKRFTKPKEKFVPFSQGRSLTLTCGFSFIESSAFKCYIIRL